MATFEILCLLIRFIYLAVSIETLVTMSTVQVEDDVKRELFAVAAELQSRLGRRVSLNETIRMLLKAYRSKERNVARMLSLFGSLGSASESRKLLTELRAEEEMNLGRLARKHNT